MRGYRLLGMVLAGVAAAGWALADGGPNPMPPRESFWVFLLIGQSNMAGRGVPEAEDKTAHPRVWVLNKENAWAPAVDPLHFDKPSMVGVGPGLAFGKAVAEKHPEVHVGLIPCAFGGTAIAEWKKGGRLYTDAVARAQTALKAGVLKGILWHQGEADTASAKRAIYPAALKQLVSDLREDLAAPEVPFLFGQIGQFLYERGESPKAFNEMLLTLPPTISHTACVTSEGLEHKGDKLHFNAASQREFGRRYAKAWEALANEAR